MDEQTWDDFRFEKPSSRMIALPTEPMERIFHFLDARDKYEACLVHPNWSIVAMSSLWKAPRFKRPEPLRTFLRITSSVKKVALLVRDFHLAFLDDQEDSVFRPLVLSCLERHQQQNALPLAKPNLIYDLARYCENMTDLVCYGWQMKPGDWDRMLGVAHKLSCLTVIGCQQPINIHALIKLKKLHLDGSLGINEAWMSSLVNKATYLKDLKISLENVSFRTFTILCTPGCLELESLTLTRATCLTDENVFCIARAFPSLRVLILEGCSEITSKTICAALTLWPQLEHLEIRSSLQYNSRIEKPEIQSTVSHFKLKKLYLENHQVNDDVFQLLGPLLPHLQTVGFKSCSRLTPQGVCSILGGSRIKALHIIDCPQIDSTLFDFFANTYISDIYIQSCGQIVYIDLFRLCLQSSHLRSIQIVGYDELKEYITDKYHPNISSPSTHAKLVLNQGHIQRLAKAYETDFCLPKERFLSSRQIFLLAKRLKMKPKELNSLLDSLEQDKTQEGYNGPESKAKKAIPLKNCWNQTRSFSLTSRPDTPTVWNNDYKRYGAIPSGQDFSTVLDKKSEPNDFDNTPTLKELQKEREGPYWDNRKSSSEFSYHGNQNPRGSSRQAYQVMRNDNWGKPHHNFEWNDCRTQSYAYEVLEKQKSTAYFDDREKKRGFEDIDPFGSFQSDKAFLSAHKNTSPPSPKVVHRPFPLISSDEDPCWDDNDSERKSVKAYASTVDPKSENYSSIRRQRSPSRKKTNRNTSSLLRSNFSSRERFSSEKKEKEKEVYGVAEDQWANIAKLNPERKRNRAPKQKKSYISHREEHNRYEHNEVEKIEDYKLSEARTFSPLSVSEVSETVTLINLEGGETVPSAYSIRLIDCSEPLTPEPICVSPIPEVDKKIVEPVCMVETSDLARRQSVSAYSTDSMEWRDKVYEMTPEETDPSDESGEVESQGSNGSNLFSFQCKLSNPLKNTANTAHEISFESLVEEIPLENSRTHLPSQTTTSSSVSIPSPLSIGQKRLLENRISSTTSFGETNESVPTISEDISFESLVQELSSSVESQHIPPIVLPTLSKSDISTMNEFKDSGSLPVDSSKGAHITNTPNFISSLSLEYCNKKTSKKKTKPGLLFTKKVYVSENRIENIHLTMDEPIKETVQKFCAKYNVPHIEKQLILQLEPIYTTKKTSVIFGTTSQNQRKKK
ncbi:hypothetical protein BY458DRAFT_498738 [Sporodiniella umbellata]|nr:hypothetical protein BY458DRAFT_498738 [Sporodiniella umbellata]